MSIRCSQGHENPDTGTFCDECGEPLPTSASMSASQVDEDAPTLPASAGDEPAADEVPTQIAPPAPMFDEEATEIASAPPAEAPMVAEPTPSAPPAEEPAPAAPVAAQPRLLVESSGTSFDLAGKSSVVVGREDVPSNSFPDVDLTPYGAEEGGVSRLHARVTQSGETWTIEDLDSTNFTFINRKRIQPKTPTPLNDGDEIRLGRVGLRFKTEP